jgi:hypothetical protein
MAQKWYEKASVQTAIVTGIFLILVAIISIWFNNKVQGLESDVANKNLQIQLLDSQLEPFKTIALEHFTGTEAQALSRLALHLNNLESSISDVKKYTFVASLGPNGSTNDNTGDIIITTPISIVMQDALSEDKVSHNINFKCDDASIARYKQVIGVNVNFPFSYYALAICLSEKNDSSALEYAKKAYEILKVTTTIDGHHPAHDEVLSHIESLFLSQSAKK